MATFMHRPAAVRSCAAIVGVALVVALGAGGCQTSTGNARIAERNDRPLPHSASVAEAVPHVVTADIQAGIERHIAEQTQRNGGYFPLMYESRELRLKLVRVHLEYLANLGPRRHFACSQPCP